MLRTVLDAGNCPCLVKYLLECGYLEYNLLGLDFPLTGLSGNSPKLLHVSIVHSFLLLSSVPWLGYITTEDHLDYFQGLAIKNKAMMYICEQFFV